jgi:hypothetical protein
MCEGGSGSRRRRRWDLLKDLLVGGLQSADLVRHLVLTGGELLDGLSNSRELLRHRLLYCGDICL